MSHVVELARAEVEDNPLASSAIRQFAGLRTKDAERRAHEVLQQHNLTVKVPIERMDLDGPLKCHKGFPYIKFSSWVRFLWESGRLARTLCACNDVPAMCQKLEVFWTRYRGIYPSHKIFEMEIDLRYVIPVYSHSDEGRSLKHMPVWILSVHGAVGRGTQDFLDKQKDQIPLHRSGLGLNFIGNDLEHAIHAQLYASQGLQEESSSAGSSCGCFRCRHAGSVGEWDLERWMRH